VVAGKPRVIAGFVLSLLVVIFFLSLVVFAIVN